MARQIACPRCLETLTEQTVRYVDRSGNSAAKPQVAYQRDLGSWAKAVWRGAPDPLYRTDPKARADALALGVRAECSNGHRIPEHAFDVPTIVVAMVGESASGKTVYLGTLLEQLDRHQLPALNFETDEDSEELRNAVFGEFYLRNQPPLPTAPGRQDLQREAITGVVTADGSPQYYISFFDASGEENKRADPGRVNRFLFRADVVMHFLTAEALGLPRVSPPRSDQRQTWYVTKTALTTGLAPSSPDAHAAVIVPKSDDIDPAALDMLTAARAELDFRSMGLARAYDVIAQDSAYLRDVLLKSPNSDALVERIEQHYRSTSYHLVSATGGPADPRTERFPTRMSQRVLDPLLASLVATGMLDLASGRAVPR